VGRCSLFNTAVKVCFYSRYVILIRLLLAILFIAPIKLNAANLFLSSCDLLGTTVSWPGSQGEVGLPKAFLARYSKDEGVLKWSKVLLEATNKASTNAEYKGLVWSRSQAISMSSGALAPLAVFGSIYLNYENINNLVNPISVELMIENIYVRDANSLHPKYNTSGPNAASLFMRFLVGNQLAMEKVVDMSPSIKKVRISAKKIVNSSLVKMLSRLGFKDEQTGLSVTEEKINQVMLPPGEVYNPDIHDFNKITVSLYLDHLVNR